ncbi:MAG TPA: hypothetical protein ENG95_05320 [Nitrospirae bacterium]|nr:hypothetical protein BMS3Abin10_00922 [bacterium BMS3Abin10]GBE39658.1 hypothetical protein BMS3Bbin08_02289 [bacterium BMS3Bbin08]HDH49784.1 hypothetical protein [Nitrospirota bacterium]HDK82069.1 hypothetical protein [Nitrospirota bacterium]HDO26041.1 hypothetical protein [Nitrospirota bacterium]
MSSDVRKSAGTQGRLKKKRKESMRIYLSGDALMSLLISSAEVFKRESLGYLLGYRLEDRFIIEHAFSLQTARRKRRGVVLTHRDQKRIEPILSRFEKLQIVGDFHSHTSYGETKGLPIPSKIDVDGMEPGNLYVIIAVNEKQRSSAWRENRNGTISGSIENLFFTISAYLCAGAKDGCKPLKTPIYCSFPPGLRAG